jgi:hypothetical protein
METITVYHECGHCKVKINEKFYKYTHPIPTHTPRQLFFTTPKAPSHDAVYAFSETP